MLKKLLYFEIYWRVSHRTKKWAQPQFLSVDEWMKKVLYVYMMEYYSDINIHNGLLSSVTTWMELEIIMLRESSQV